MHGNRHGDCPQDAKHELMLDDHCLSTASFLGRSPRTFCFALRAPSTSPRIFSRILPEKPAAVMCEANSLRLVLRICGPLEGSFRCRQTLEILKTVVEMLDL